MVNEDGSEIQSNPSLKIVEAYHKGLKGDAMSAGRRAGCGYGAAVKPDGYSDDRRNGPSLQRTPTRRFCDLQQLPARQYGSIFAFDGNGRQRPTLPDQPVW